MGTRTRVLCGLVRGDTPVSFSWLKNGRPLTGARRRPADHTSVTSHDPPVTITIVDDFSSLLTISRLERGHAGNYTCLASNLEAGSDQFTTFLDVQGDCCRVFRQFFREIFIRKFFVRIIFTKFFVKMISRKNICEAF